MSKKKSTHWALTLVAWFEKAKRTLPWRHTHRDPYAVWISEIMLQQTQVKTVIPYFERFLKSFPSVHALSASPLDVVLKHWEGLGYYSRGRNLHKAAHLIVQEHGGVFPKTYAAIRSLPGIGDYTAGAIASLAFNQKYLAIDGNVKRVVSRLFGISDDLSTPAGKAIIESILNAAIPDHFPGAFNEALMELGAQVCTPKNPACPACPLNNTCRAYALGDPEIFPTKAKRLKPNREVHHVFLLTHNHHILVEKNPPAGLWGGLHGFPNLRTETKPMTVKKAQLFFQNMFGQTITTLKIHKPFKHQLTHKTIFFSAIEGCCTKRDIPMKGNWRWVKRNALNQLAFSTAHQKIIKLLETP